MNVNIGILGDPRGWQLLLEQEGVPFSGVSEGLTPENYSVLVAGDDVDDRESEMLRQYLSLGGSVLCSSKIYAQIRRSTYEREQVKYILPGEGSLFADVGLIDVRGRCKLAWNANELKTDGGIFSAHVGEHESGHVVALPFDPSLMILDGRSATKSFYSPEVRLPFERVSYYVKSSIRRLVSRSLELLHHRRGLPYVHRWYFPRNAASVCVLRVDTDYGSTSEIEGLYGIARNHNVPMTWFVDVKSQQSFLSLFKKMEGQEIGLHCYEHQTYEDYERNEQNINRALKLLKSSSIDVKGFAAPYGVWNQNLGRAVQKCGMEYSTEFSYDHDNVPSFPLLHGEWSKTLQIPVHPVCVGSLRRQGYLEEQMKSYFGFVVSQKLSLREPLAFYHHPKDGNHPVLESLFKMIRDNKIEMKTMGGFASWWKRRNSVRPAMQVQGSTLAVQSGSKDDEVWLHLTRQDGTESFSPLRDAIELDSLHWQRRLPANSLPADYLRIRRFNYRIPLTKGVDYMSNKIRMRK